MWPQLLADACRRAARAEHRAGALEEVLGLLRSACGAERAFLVDGARSARRGRILSASGAGTGGTISWSVATRALHGERALFLPALGGSAAWEGASIRGLALRAAAAVPVRRRSGPPAAIVLDGRAPLSVDSRAWEALSAGFAGLCGLLLDGAPPAAGPADAAPPGIGGLVGESAAMRALRGEIVRAAGIPLPALVLGASGTGKELVARALHDGGPRAGGPFVAVNCSAIPETLLERELFGSERGAFTGADRDHPGLFRLAEGGTILLDEIGDMPLALQAKLLRVLQEGAVRPLGAVAEARLDVRVVAATHRDLAVLVSEGRFRADLRYRLAVLVLRLPTLVERLEDLPALADRLLERLARRCGVPRPRLTASASTALARHGWPGNVRELESVLARAVVRAGGREIGQDDLEFDPAARAPAEPPSPPGACDEALERAMIVEALACARGNLTLAAERIGWNRQKLYRRLRALRLSREDARRSAGAQDGEVECA